MSESPVGSDIDINSKIDNLQSQFNKLVLQIEKNMKHYIQIDRKFTVISVDIMEIKDDLEIMKNVINSIRNELETTDKFKDELKQELNNTVDQLKVTNQRVENIISALQLHDPAIQIQNIT